MATVGKLLSKTGFTVRLALFAYTVAWAIHSGKADAVRLGKTSWGVSTSGDDPWSWSEEAQTLLLRELSPVSSMSMSMPVKAPSKKSAPWDDEDDSDGDGDGAGSNDGALPGGTRHPSSTMVPTRLGTGTGDDVFGGTPSSATMQPTVTAMPNAPSSSPSVPPSAEPTPSVPVATDAPTALLAILASNPQGGGNGGNSENSNNPPLQLDSSAVKEGSDGTDKSASPGVGVGGTASTGMGTPMILLATLIPVAAALSIAVGFKYFQKQRSSASAASSAGSHDFGGTMNGEANDGTGMMNIPI